MINELKRDLMESRKKQEKEKVIILSTVIGEIQTLQSRDKNKDISNQDIIKLIDKSIDALQERIKLRPDTKEQCTFEINVLKKYVPTKLTEEQIRKIKLDNGFTSAKELMPFLKANYNGLFDGKLASKIAGE